MNGCGGPPQTCRSGRRQQRDDAHLAARPTVLMMRALTTLPAALRRPVPACAGHGRLQPSQLLDSARQPCMCGIADIELVPACDVAAAPFSKQELDAYAKTLEQAGGADHIFDDRPVASLLLDA